MLWEGRFEGKSRLEETRDLLPPSPLRVLTAPLARAYFLSFLAVWDARETDIYFQKAIHRVRFLDFVDSEFFVKALRASADDRRLAEYFTGTGIKHFTGKGLAAYLFPLPPPAEQRGIVAKVNELMVLCDRLEASLTTSTNTQRYLLDSFLHHALDPNGNCR